MTEETNTTIAPATASRRAVLTGIAAVPLAAVPFTPAAAYDPIAAMLRRRNVMLRAAELLPEDDAIQFAACDERYAFECTIIGMPILSLTGAALALDAFQQKNCCDDLDEWVLEAVHTFLLPHMGVANA